MLLSIVAYDKKSHYIEVFTGADAQKHGMRYRLIVLFGAKKCISLDTSKVLSRMKSMNYIALWEAYVIPGAESSKAAAPDLLSRGLIC